ncbi:MAG: hypothetical protein VB080_09760 [Propionicimonas sp.]|uniref:CG0192-related protein n=1 Tax=Propionicimonas sp. TaxID=1955623 RepID=UPI002B1EEA2D|nr:hypothetical protein [Propionicimonas sp.]MEA4944705.1 hypothetical protein [Propionicimonas sp.]
MSGTAEIHDATLTPGKLELLAGWIGAQPWFAGDPADLEVVGSFRFVDPDGEVGIQTLLVRSGGVTYQVPLTYRAAPLEDATDALIGTSEHSVLGTRYVYDAVSDPVYAIETFRVIHEGDTEAELSRGEKTATVQGSGITPVSNAATEAVRLVRVLDGNHIPHTMPLGTLIGTWQEDGAERSEILAILR